jgi:hypothetical protein
MHRDALSHICGGNPLRSLARSSNGSLYLLSAPRVRCFVARNFGEGWISLKRPVAERVGFEPTIRGYRIHTFQACAFDHSATAPHRPFGKGGHLASFPTLRKARMLR